MPSEWTSRASTQIQTESEVSASLPAPSALTPGFSVVAGAGRGAEEGRENGCAQREQGTCVQPLGTGVCLGSECFHV